MSLFYHRLSRSLVIWTSLLTGMLALSSKAFPQQRDNNANEIQQPPSQPTNRAPHSSTGKIDESGNDQRMPRTAIEYARMCEPELGVPPHIDLDRAVEIPIFIDGKQVYGNYPTCDNPVLIGKSTVSGSVIQRYEGRTAKGVKLPHVVWVAFGRNSSSSPARVVGSVQMIGYNTQTGATAFFESGDQIAPWVSLDKDTWRMRGTMPWIDNPTDFNQAFVPAPMQCVQCHQNDPFITNSFITAAKISGTEEPVIPILDANSPYHVIGGSHWDMRTINIKDNACFDCHRVGMKTIELFTQSGWDVNEHMPPDDPGSLADAYQQLLAAWQRGPEKVSGADWIIPPARGTATRPVGADYPHKAAFNRSAIGGALSGKERQAQKLDLLKTRYFDSSRQFQKQVAKGTLTQEEADKKLSEILQQILAAAQN
jgi:hypothetical protein